MSFPKHLLAKRKEQGLTQQMFADKIGIHVAQYQRYEYGESQPTLDVLKKIAQGLNVSIDELVFDKTERDPIEELRLQFEAIKGFTPQEMAVAKGVLDSLILKHHASQLSTMGNQPAVE